MNAETLVGLMSVGPNAAVLAALGGEPGWNVDSDWGLDDWRVERAPAGLKFRLAPLGVVHEEVMVARVAAADRAALERLARRAQVPMHLVFVDRPGRAVNRIAKHFLHPHGGRDQ